MAKGIQFRGRQAIMATYDNMGIMAWALVYSEKNLVSKYPSKQLSSDVPNMDESRANLDQILKSMEASGGEAIHTLRLYEDIPKGGIKLSTEADYSFNFILILPEDSYRARSQGYSEIMDRLEAIDRRLQIAEAVEDSEDQDSPEQSPILGFINGIVSDDRFKNKIQDLIFSFSDKLFSENKSANVVPMNKQIPSPASVGKITDESPVLIDQDQHEKLQQAVNILIRIDPKLGDNLLKLAKSGATDPGKYSKLVAMLNTML